MLMLNTIFQHILISLLFLHQSNALYSSSDDVIILDDYTFESKVEQSDGIWVIEFYSPNCGHCVNFAPIYKKFATAVKGIINVAAIDAAKNVRLAHKFDIKGYPTIKIFAGDMKTSTDYRGSRSVDGLVQESFDAAKKLINKRTGKRDSDSSSSEGSGSSSAVIELTDSNFDKVVLADDSIWFIGFFAPWCGHCQRLKPDYESAASKMKGKVKFGSVDATIHKGLASRYNINGFPTLYVFGDNKKSPEQYEGGRSSTDMVNYLNEKLLASLPPPKAYELTKEDQLDICKEKQLCIIAALPDILDCQSKCRNDYIKMVEKAGEKHKANDWNYFWFAAATQPDVEKALNIGGFGYPALVAMNQKKQKFASMRGSFSTEGIHEFLRDVSLGSRSINLQTVSSLPKVIKTDAWDGKDQTMPHVEEISLDDLKDEL